MADVPKGAADPHNALIRANSGDFGGDDADLSSLVSFGAIWLRSLDHPDVTRLL
jgi:hypothetical protein